MKTGETSNTEQPTPNIEGAELFAATVVGPDGRSRRISLWAVPPSPLRGQTRSAGGDLPDLGDTLASASSGCCHPQPSPGLSGKKSDGVSLKTPANHRPGHRKNQRADEALHHGSQEGSRGEGEGAPAPVNGGGAS